MISAGTQYVYRLKKTTYLFEVSLHLFMPGERTKASDYIIIMYYYVHVIQWCYNVSMVVYGRLQVNLDGWSGRHKLDKLQEANMILHWPGDVSLLAPLELTGLAICLCPQHVPHTHSPKPVA